MKIYQLYPFLSIRTPERMEYKIYIIGGILTILVVAFYWILVNRNSK